MMTLSIGYVVCIKAPTSYLFNHICNWLNILLSRWKSLVLSGVAKCYFNHSRWWSNNYTFAVRR